MKKPIMIATVVLAMSVAHASASVIYSNFGTDDAYDPKNASVTIGFGGPTFGVKQEQAVAFTVVGGSYYLTSANFALIHSWGPDLVYANVHSDQDGVPGAILDSTTATGVQQGSEWAPPMTATFSGNVVLEEGNQYWLALKTEEVDAALSWANNVVDDFGLRAWQNDDGGWNPFDDGPPPRGVFRVNGALVPAPGPLALFAFAGFSRGKRRRN